MDGTLQADTLRYMARAEIAANALMVDATHEAAAAFYGCHGLHRIAGLAANAVPATGKGSLTDGCATVNGMVGLSDIAAAWSVGNFVLVRLALINNFRVKEIIQRLMPNGKRRCYRRQTPQAWLLLCSLTN